MEIINWSGIMLQFALSIFIGLMTGAAIFAVFAFMFPLVEVLYRKWKKLLERIFKEDL